MQAGAKVTGYVRVSTREQGDSGLGLEAQLAKIEAECRHRGWELAGVEQDVASGSSMQRPGLDRALDSVASGSVQAVVAARLDRVSRSALDFAVLIDRARRDGWRLVVLDVGLDMTTPQGELMAGVLAQVAQFERRLISDRTREALAAARARGTRLGAPPRPVADGLPAAIRKWRRAGWSLRRIADELESAGVPAPGGARWYPSSVRRVSTR